MIRPEHVNFVLNAPRSGWLKCADFFALVEKLDPAIQDELFLDLYHAYDLFEEEPEDEDSIKPAPGRRYPKFKKVFLETNKNCKEENYLVFGLVSYILAEAYRKSGLSRFSRILDSHRSLKSLVHDEIRKEELEPKMDWKQELREVVDKIESLHQELEVSHRAYKAFCETVVAPLVTHRD